MYVAVSSVNNMQKLALRVPGHCIDYIDYLVVILSGKRDSAWAGHQPQVFLHICLHLAQANSICVALSNGIIMDQAFVVRIILKG